MFEPEVRNPSRKWRVHRRGVTMPDDVDGVLMFVEGVAVFRVLNGRELIKMTAYPIDTIEKIETRR